MVTLKSLLAKESERIVNVKSVVPESPSLSVTSLIDKDAVSSLIIVPRPVASSMVTRVVSATASNVAADKSTVNVSSISTISSPATLTVTVVVSEPAVMTAGCAAIDVKSVPPSASRRLFVSTVTPRSLLENRFVLMVKTKSVTPESPSFIATSSIDNAAVSSFRIVPSPLLSPMVARDASTFPSNKAAERSTVNVSSISTTWSPATLTVTTVESMPAEMMAGWALMDV